MRIISAQALDADPGLYGEIAQVLSGDGLVCFPCRRQYSIAASLLSEVAVMRLVQSKRRSEKAPALVFVPDRKTLAEVVESVPASAAPLIDAFWPGQLTMMLEPSAQLPSKVLKTLGQKKLGKIGVRIPSPGIPLRLVEAFGGPVLTSSANLSRKTGSHSVSNIRKAFSHTVDLLIDAGDLQPEAPSTVVELVGDSLQVVREGGIPADSILEILRRSGQPAAG